MSWEPPWVLWSPAVYEELGIWEPSRQDVKRKCHLEAEITRDIQTAFLETQCFVEGKEEMTLYRHIWL